MFYYTMTVEGIPGNFYEAANLAAAEERVEKDGYEILDFVAPNTIVVSN